ncbi:MAG TPA: alpha/beta hydrolase-fold protein [Frateuria sp.]|uniref:alpha/beta hydrolase-fold protein n=1 Tax=Frateuria sp. TaxID=2211372 RepID=UPI002D7E46F1|nr:alpha/beta hydrolase-fold protein [Frateuria sp.]HET6804748.1 alpha/beta hydrolase-fold protein [Frateuria sp.]
MRLRPSTLFGPLVALLLAACTAGGDITRPIPTRFVPAAQSPHRLVVMLPGRGDDLDSLTARGIGQMIHQQWPDADVILAGLTMPFYRQGRAVGRLHDEVLVPAARAQHYDQVWLAGISLGGLGALMYDRVYPGEIDGMLLISPYLGDRSLYREIQAAGGLAHWQAGPEQAFTPETYQRELWRYIQRWSDRPDRSRSVWLAYGDKERFRDRIGLLATQLPADHVFELPGHHNWTLWRPAARTLLQHARQERRAAAASTGN